MFDCGDRGGADDWRAQARRETSSSIVGIIDVIDIIIIIIIGVILVMMYGR